MTLVGHAFTGMAIGVCLLPSPLRSRRGLAGLLLCGFCANLPDLPVHGWGHDGYHVSHSLFVNLVLTGLGAGLVLLTHRVSGRLLLACLAAWMSHFLLDTLYSHGKGISLFWPISKARLALPIPIFDTLGGWPPPWNQHSIRVFAIELVVYGLLFAAICLGRWVNPRARIAYAPKRADSKPTGGASDATKR
jgi:hypothetical protein